jgi:hypothetical protein
MQTLPIITERELGMLRPEAVIEFYMKLQQIALMSEDELETLRRIVKAQQDLLKLAGYETPELGK